MSQLITCPECKKHLQVPEDLIGKKVQCPECKHTFTAEESTPTEVVSAAKSVPKPMSSSAAKKKAEWDKDDDDEEDSRSRKSKAPSKRRRDDDDDDDDDDDRRPGRSRRSRYAGSRYAPHRGGMILAFGIISMVSFVMGIPLAIIFGPMAWIMGNADMAEIRAGRMDPSGEGTVQTGRVLGIISTIICAVSLLAVVGICCIFGMIGAMAPQQRRG
jgi:predicted Zn finger-like uncharacterized protein